MAQAHPMLFRNYGGISQFSVVDEQDLAAIDALDPARWAATSAPLHDLHCDPAFLAALDPDSTGRIRVSQLVAARDWMFARLTTRTGIKARSDALVLAHLTSDDTGKALRAAADDVIAHLKLTDVTQLKLAEVRAFRASYQQTLENGDGIVPAEVVTDTDLADFIKAILATTGGAKDASGNMGAGQAQLDTFTERAKAWLAWRAKGAEAKPWGDDTEAAAAAVSALDAKLEEYFWLCDLLQQESQTASTLRLSDDDVRALRTQDPGAIEKYLTESPIAPPVSTGTLALSAHINPVYAERFALLSSSVLAKALVGESQLTRTSWRRVKATFAAYAGWNAEKPSEPFDALGEDKVRAFLDGPLPKKLVDAIALDNAAAPHIGHVGDLEKLILLQRGLVELANNFVNFSAIYKPSVTALVEMGSLVIDGRRLDFCLKVDNHDGHKKVAAESLIYLAYVNITAKDGAAPAYEIVAPVTAGERGRLRVGKRGIFIDLDNKEWDAQVIEIVENPISLREAAFAPFRRAQQFVSKKIAEWVAAAQSKSEQGLMDKAATSVTHVQQTAEQAAQDVKDGKAPPAPPPPPAAAPAPAGKPLDTNSLIIGGGIALAGVSTIFASIFGLLRTLEGWLAIAGVIGAVLALSALVGWLKLRRRDMGLVLEASGWALNIRMQMNLRVGRLFTFTPALPRGAVVEHIDVLATPEDAAAERTRTFTVVLLVVLGLLALYWGFGMSMPHPAELEPFMRHEAPAKVETAQPVK
jgi:hypothetical protein